MKDIVRWLGEVEDYANQVYRLAATVFADDPKLNKFLMHIAEYEAWHHDIMGRAETYLTSAPRCRPAITIDAETSARILGCFDFIKEGLERPTLSKDELIEKIVEAEFSEWNDIFIYVINSLKQKSDEFKYPAARMQAHFKGIAHFVDKAEYKTGVLKMVNNLPPIWVEKILIVDDSPAISSILKDILNRDGDIDIAHNGKDAIALIEKNIISWSFLISICRSWTA